MGIFNFVKQGVQEMLIQRPDAKKGLIVYKHPDQTVPHYAQLTVDADEAAVFFRDGSIVGTLRTAGSGQRHTLSSQNIPFLGRLLDNVTGGNIFTTDLFFVTMRPVYEQKFGGELGYVEDPTLGEMVTPRIFGEYAFQIVDPERFIVNYVGLRTVAENNDGVTRWIAGKFMNSVTTVVGEILVHEQKSMLQLMPLQSHIADKLVERAPDLNDIGVRIVQLGKFQINLTDEDRNRLTEAQAEIGKAKRAARVANIGIATAQAEAAQKQFELDQKFTQDQRYVQQLAGGNFGQYAAGSAMMGAGQGMAKGGEGSGNMLGIAGMAMGANMGQMMGGAMMGGGMQQPQQPPPQQPPAAGTSAALVTCPSCNAQVVPGKFCAECGQGLAPKPKFCPACGAQGAPGGKFCASCGTGYPP